LRKVAKYWTAAPVALLACTYLIPPIAVALDDPAAGISPVVDADFYEEGLFSEAKVRLGRLLFFDKILSGNRNISCATCHHPRFATSDGVALSLGEGAIGVGPARRVVPHSPVLGRVPRNTQALFFVGAREFQRLLHDGRVEQIPNARWPSGIRSPAFGQLPARLENVLAAQVMFPLVSMVEMAGHDGENEIATALTDSFNGLTRAWTLLARRLQEIPEYVSMFRNAFPEIKDAGSIRFAHTANAIAAFEAATFRPDDSPFDRYLRSRDPRHLSKIAFRGMQLFYGDAGCGSCHTGKFLTDHKFHAIAMPQIGPGKNHGTDRSYWNATGFLKRLEDQGRFRLTLRAGDMFSFRTPSLRNVALTGPWGHAGTFRSLQEVVRHHFDPVGSLQRFDANRVSLTSLNYVIEQIEDRPNAKFARLRGNRLREFQRRDTWVQRTDWLRKSIAKANTLGRRKHTEADVNALVAFLNALTDQRSRNMADIIPARVPSGLTIDR
jgi:cytochrome c peroxidase